MAKHTQTIRHCLSVFDHFVNLALKNLKIKNPSNCSYSNYSAAVTAFVEETYLKLCNITDIIWQCLAFLQLSFVRRNEK